MFQRYDDFHKNEIVYFYKMKLTGDCYKNKI